MTRMIFEKYHTEKWDRKEGEIKWKMKRAHAGGLTKQKERRKGMKGRRKEASWGLRAKTCRHTTQFMGTLSMGLGSDAIGNFAVAPTKKGKKEKKKALKYLNC